MEVHYVNLHQFVCVCFSVQDDSGWAVDQTSYSGELSTAVQDSVANSNAAGNVSKIKPHTLFPFLLSRVILSHDVYIALVVCNQPE